MDTFRSLYAHGFVRAAVCVPLLRVADPVYNAEQTIHLARQASETAAAIALFPEMGLSAYTNEDLFHQDAFVGRDRSGTRACRRGKQCIKPDPARRRPASF